MKENPPHAILEPWVVDEMTDMEIVNYISDRVAFNISNCAAKIFGLGRAPNKDEVKLIKDALRKTWFENDDDMERGKMTAEKRAFAKQLLTEVTPAPEPEEQREFLFRLLKMGEKEDG